MRGFWDLFAKSNPQGSFRRIRRPFGTVGPALGHEAARNNHWRFSIEFSGRDD